MSSNRTSLGQTLNELNQLKSDLNCDKPSRRKDALRNVISAMTSGKDVSKIFVDVLNCSQSNDLETKKLVYSYLLNYSENNPDMAIMAVNSFAKDANDSLPLVRALAIRTMACMNVGIITEYLCEPLRKCLRDSDPYVRKTAVLCIGKLYKIDPKLVHDQGFANIKQYLSDSNSMVVSNAVATLAEMQGISLGKRADISSSELNLLMSALNECGEWGQVSILDYVAAYEPFTEKEAKTICERVTQRLSHSNSGVVMSTIKVILRMMSFVEDETFLDNCDKKLCNPLITMLSGPPEIQYVVLRNIILILQKRPNVLSNHVTCFFAKYNDEIYVKLEKLDIIIRLTTFENIGAVLPELKEYASGVDIDFVRKSVRAIGCCAIKIPEVAEQCVLTLYELVKTKVDYIIQEAIVVIRDIFRKYPNKYESIIGTLCENIEYFDETEAKAALIWIVGEYADRINNADELLTSFFDNFSDEDPQVQLQLLTALVKHYLKKPNVGKDPVEKILDLCTKVSDNPDLRDRGYMYWRLISGYPEDAKKIILGQKPAINENIDSLDPVVLKEMIKHIGSVASVTHKPPRFLFGEEDNTPTVSKQETAADSFKLQKAYASIKMKNKVDNLMDFGDELLVSQTAGMESSLLQESSAQNVQSEMSTLDSLLDLNFALPMPAQQPVPQQQHVFPQQPVLGESIFQQPAKEQSTYSQQPVYPQSMSSQQMYPQQTAPLNISNMQQPPVQQTLFNQPQNIQQSLPSQSGSALDFDFFLPDDPPAYNWNDPMSFQPQPLTLKTNSTWVSRVSSNTLQMAVSWDRKASISVFVDIMSRGTQDLTLTNIGISQNSFGLFVPCQPSINPKSQNQISFSLVIEFQRSLIMSSPAPVYPNLVVTLNQGTLQTSVHHAVLFNPSGQLSTFQQHWWSPSQSDKMTTATLEKVPFDDENSLIEELKKLNIFMAFKSTDEAGRTLMNFSMKFDNSALVLAILMVSFVERKALLAVICPNPNTRDIVIKSFNSIFSEYA